MRDALSFNMIPIVEENLEEISFNPGLRNQIVNISSSNGYYGYQPPLMLPSDQKQTVYDDTVTPTVDNNRNNCDTTDMDIQFNCYADIESCADQMQIANVRSGDIHRGVSKKRQWDAEFTAEFDNTLKKPRQNCDEPVDPFLSTVPEQHPPSSPQSNQKLLHLRTPTHNIPDLPRCIMGHYI